MTGAGSSSARRAPGRQTAATAITSHSSSAVPVVVQPIPIRSTIGPWSSDPIG
jgi:hypothetical protein